MASSLVKADEAAVSAWLPANQEKVEAFYEANPTRFNKAERVRIHGIQFRAANRARLEGEADEAEKAKLQKERDDARAKAEAAYKKLAGELEVPAALAAAPAPEGAEKTEADAKPKSVAVDLAAFEAAARESSEHGPTKELGGLFEEARDKERLGRYPFGKEVVEPVFAMEVGHMTGVIEVDTGFWILRKESALPAESKTLDQARMEIATELYKEAQGE